MTVAALPHRIADAVAAACLWAGGGLVAAISVLTVADVAARYLLSAPIRGAVEMVQIALPLIVFCGFILISRDRLHITVSLLEPVLGPRMLWVYRALNLGFTVLGAVVVAAILARVTQDFVAYQQTSLVLRLALWPLALLMALLAGLGAALALIGPGRNAGGGTP